MLWNHPFATAAAAAGDALLKQALRVAEQALKTSRSTEVCAAQCNCLGTAFAHVGDCLVEWHGLFGSGGTTLTMEELVGAMKRGLQLLQSCKERSWVIRTLLLEESRQEFKEVHSKLRECIRLVSLSLMKVADVNEEWKIAETHRQFSSKMSSLDRMLSDAAAMDRTDLFRMVEESLKGFRNKLQLFRGSAIGLKMLHKSFCRQYTEDDDGLPEHLLINHKQLKLKKHIAQGAFGTVYEATWLGYPFAVKVSNEAICFDRELAALVALKHPNIVRIVGYSHEAEKQEYSIVMEKMSMDLARLIGKKKKAKDGPPFSMRVSISIMLQIAKAMSFLHSENVSHRDLKTANILVEFLENQQALAEDVDFTVKVADFGLARTNFISSQVGSRTPRCGTPGFRAPEVYDAKDYTKKADVYSYAMVCYQILTGEMPFEDIRGRKDFVVMVRDEGKRPELPSSCPPDLAALLRNCWSGSPSERPSFSDICDILNLFKAQMLTSNSLSELKELENELNYPISLVEGCLSNELFFFDMVRTGYQLEDLHRGTLEALGVGSSAAVTYKAKLEDGNLLAVKRLNDWKTPQDSLEQWIKFIGSMNHMNIAPLKAYYFGKAERLLVYDYMGRGSLSTLLHGGKTTLDWPSRVRIAIGAARGIAYLHQRGICHGRIHSSNILLGENLEALVSDAGLAYVWNSTSEEGDIHQVATLKTDVYNFGVLLLELLTRQKPPDASVGEMDGWVKLLIQQRKTTEIFDPELTRYQNDELALNQMLHLAMTCTSLSPPATMGRVAGTLEDHLMMIS